MAAAVVAEAAGGAGNRGINFVNYASVSGSVMNKPAGEHGHTVRSWLVKLKKEKDAEVKVSKLVDFHLITFLKTSQLYFPRTLVALDMLVDFLAKLLNVREYPTDQIDGTIEPEFETFKTRNPYMGEFSLLKTTGDGSCLIHAFLMSVSPTFRRLQKDIPDPEDKVRSRRLVVYLFRSAYVFHMALRAFKEGDIGKEEKDLVWSTQNGYSEYLDSSIVNVLCEHFKIQFLLFGNTGGRGIETEPKPLESDESKPRYFMYFKGEHYWAMQYNGQYSAKISNDIVSSIQMIQGGGRRRSKTRVRRSRRLRRTRKSSRQLE